MSPADKYAELELENKALKNEMRTLSHQLYDMQMQLMAIKMELRYLKDTLDIPVSSFQTQELTFKSDPPTTPPTQQNLDLAIDTVFSQLGIYKFNTSILQTKNAIKIYILSPTPDIYAELAAKYNSTKAAIDRNIRYVAEIAKKNNAELYQELFGEVKTKVFGKTFLKIIANYVMSLSNS
jgi:Sporulation initiation factor Spo0A C terminal.